MYLAQLAHSKQQMDKIYMADKQLYEQRQLFIHEIQQLQFKIRRLHKERKHNSLTSSYYDSTSNSLKNNGEINDSKFTCKEIEMIFQHMKLDHSSGNFSLDDYIKSKKIQDKKDFNVYYIIYRF